MVGVSLVLCLLDRSVPASRYLGKMIYPPLSHSIMSSPLVSNLPSLSFTIVMLILGLPLQRFLVVSYSPFILPRFATFLASLGTSSAHSLLSLLKRLLIDHFILFLSFSQYYISHLFLSLSNFVS